MRGANKLSRSLRLRRCCRFIFNFFVARYQQAVSRFPLIAGDLSRQVFGEPFAFRFYQRTELQNRGRLGDRENRRKKKSGFLFD